MAEPRLAKEIASVQAEMGGRKFGAAVPAGYKSKDVIDKRRGRWTTPKEKWGDFKTEVHQYLDREYPTKISPLGPIGAKTPLADAEGKKLEADADTMKKQTNGVAGAIPSYKKGGLIKKTGPANLHKGERVIPKAKVAKVDKLMKKRG